MSARLLAEMIGKHVLVGMGDGVSALCQIEDTKIAYGRTRLLVRPVAGTGARWIEADKALIIAPGSVHEYVKGVRYAAAPR